MFINNMSENIGKRLFIYLPSHLMASWTGVSQCQSRRVASHVLRQRDRGWGGATVRFLRV